MHQLYKIHKMLTNNFDKEYNFINYVSKGQLDDYDVKEIRLIKVYNKSKMKYIKFFDLFILYLFSNDWIEFKERNIIKDSIIFYTVKSKCHKFFLIAILIESHEDGTKKEKLVLYKELNKIIYKSLISKHNLKWKK